MDNDNKPQETPVFKSTDILNTKAHNQGEYFVKTGKATFSQKLSSWSRKQKQKQNQAKNQSKTPEDSSALASSAKKSKKSPKIIIIISVILLAVVCCALAIFFLDPFGWRKKEPTPEQNYTEPSQEDIEESASVSTEVNEIFANQDVEVANAVIDEKIIATTNFNTEFKYQMARISWLINNEQCEKGLEYLQAMDESKLSKEQLFDYYNAMLFTYGQLGNQEKYEEYNNKSEAVRKELHMGWQ